MKKIIYCTYFDRHYLLKGLALQSSLKKYNPFVELWILCMDKYTYLILESMKLTNIKLITLPEFEDHQLLKAKKNRNRVEYYWTCTPSLPLYVFNKSKDCDYAVYIDTDLFFYSPSENIFTELTSNSIYIAEHRYPPEQQYRINRQGRFNVGILIFKNDDYGKKCLTRWRKQCIKWCYFREEDGKMGDQMYLNEWPKLYDKLTISRNLGVNAAPWNIALYNVKRSANEVFINSDELICYHFHQFKIYRNNHYTYAKGYELSQNIIDTIYRPYINEITEQLSRLKFFDSAFNYFDEISPKKFDKTTPQKNESIFKNLTKILAPSI